MSFWWLFFQPFVYLILLFVRLNQTLGLHTVMMTSAHNPSFSSFSPWLMVVLCCFIGAPVLAQFPLPVTEWNRGYGGNGWEELNSIQQTADNGYIMTGFPVLLTMVMSRIPTMGMVIFGQLRLIKTATWSGNSFMVATISTGPGSCGRQQMVALSLEAGLLLVSVVTSRNPVVDWMITGW